MFNFLKRRAKDASLRDRNRPAPDEPVYLISAPMIWSAHVESYLEEREIPYLKRGRKGAALAIELGAGSGIYDYFIPQDAVGRAVEEIDSLKELIGFPQA
ncbi:MAG TPA: hypothetical protein PK646_05460 [Bacillota bacterium]|jgi:hypothetical protein|nr:hypothetical protein [Fastidiosipila sp.]HPX93622.1 hypothetical protein [Bacillota bacterium]HQB81518.1 hypothetical protein [Bacillota bacterium]